MKSLSSIARLALSLVTGCGFLAVCFAQVGAGRPAFEGKIEFKVQTTVQVQYYNFLVKDERIRVETAEPDDDSPTILVDHAFKKIYILLPRNEQYVEIPNDLEASAGPHREPTGLQRTGETEKISGYTCDQFLVKTEGGEVETWATKGLGTAGTFRTSIVDPLPGSSQWQNEILAQGYFPLVMIERDSEGDELARLEATSFEKQSLSESLFRVPSSYEEISINQLRARSAPKPGRNR
jgi:hypothetical protein